MKFHFSLFLYIYERKHVYYVGCRTDAMCGCFHLINMFIVKVYISSFDDFHSQAFVLNLLALLMNLSQTHHHKEKELNENECEKYEQHKKKNYSHEEER